MREEIYSMHREYLTPEKGYRLLTIKGRENKTVILVKEVDNRRIYQSAKGTVYECGVEAVKRLEQMSNSAIEKIRDSVEMDSNGVSLFDSMIVMDNVDILLRAITASNKYSFDDLVDCSHPNVYFNYVVDYIGLKNKNFNKKLADWFWSDDYYKILLEKSPYEFSKEYNTEFVKLYGANSRQSRTNEYKMYGIVNRDLEVVLLAGTKVSTSFELAPNVGVKINGQMSDWRNTVDSNNVMQYNTYLTNKSNSQLRKVTFSTSGIQALKLVRNKKISLNDLNIASNKLKQYNDNKNVYDNVDEYRKHRHIMAQFNQIINDSKFGVGYKVVDSLAFMMRYDGFYTTEIVDKEHNIYAKLLINDKYNIGYILEGTKFIRNKPLEKYSRCINKNILKAYEVIYTECSDGTVMTKDSSMLSFLEINYILYGCDLDLVDANNIFDKEKVEKKSKKKDSKVKDKENINTEQQDKNKTNTDEISMLKEKLLASENYIKELEETIKELEGKIKDSVELSVKVMNDLRVFKNNMITSNIPKRSKKDK